MATLNAQPETGTGTDVEITSLRCFHTAAMHGADRFGYNHPFAQTTAAKAEAGSCAVAQEPGGITGSVR